MMRGIVGSQVNLCGEWVKTIYSVLVEHVVSVFAAGSDMDLLQWWTQ